MFFITGCTNWTLILEIACAAIILFVVRSLTSRVQAHHRALDGIRKSLDEITRKLETLSPPTAEAFENEEELEDLLDRAQESASDAGKTEPAEEPSEDPAAEALKDAPTDAGSDPDPDPKTMKITELREACRKRGVESKGTRAELLDRIGACQ